MYERAESELFVNANNEDIREEYYIAEEDEWNIDSYIYDNEDIEQLDDIFFDYMAMAELNTDEFYEKYGFDKPKIHEYNSDKEYIIALMKMWTVDEIDISEHYNEWFNFLTKHKILKTYHQVYQMDLSYLQCNKDYDYYRNGEWDVDALIKNDCDIDKINENLFFDHHQEYISDDIINEFYAEYNIQKPQTKAEIKQERLDWAIDQSYIDLNLSCNGFNRFNALLFVFGHDFGSAKINFLSDINKVKEEFLKCIPDILNLMNESIDDGFIKLWLPNHNIYSNEEDEKYCELIRFGGYSILEDGQKILNADAIILKDEESIQTLEYYTYKNMNQLCDYITELFEFYKEDVFNVGDKEYEQEINKKLNKIIDQYWKDGKIDFDYAEFYKNH